MNLMCFKLHERLNIGENMYITPSEKDKLFLFSAGQLAQQRKLRGVKLNYPESVAFISSAVLEGARDGKTIRELVTDAKKLLTRDDVMEGVPEMLNEVLVEATFFDGPKVVAINNPIE